MTGLVPIFRPRRFGLAVRPPRPVLGLEEPPLAPLAPVDDDAARREDVRPSAPEQRPPESLVPEAPKSCAPAEEAPLRSEATAETASRGADLTARSASAGNRAAAWRACPSPRCRRARRCRADARAGCPVPENPEALSAMLTALKRAARGLPPFEKPAATPEPPATAAPPPRGRARRSRARRRAHEKARAGRNPRGLT